LPQSDQEAARLYQLAAERGNVFAQINLGFLYETGRGGLPLDDVEAARLYRRAAEQGEPIAQNKLAMFYEEGRGGLPKKVDEATRLYKLAAEQDRNPNQKRQATEALRRLSVSMATTSPSAPSGQQLGMPVIGFLTTSGPSAGGFNISPFRSGLKEAGYVEGNNVAIDFRWANNQREMNELAADLVHHRVKVIFANGLEAALAAKTATETIPIVFSTGGDPIELGLTASIDRPAGNLTGVAIQNAELTVKRLDLLH
jgi:TPR repeat protein